MTEGGWSVGLFAGLAAATAGLMVLFYFINLIARKIPLRPLFIITSAFLFAMGIKFIGEAIQEFQEQAAPLFREFGALKVVECWGDDVPGGKLTSFPMAVKKEENESVVFSWVVWPSREVRDAGWKQLMADPRMTSQANPMPYDGKRLIYGGFQTIVEM